MNATTIQQARKVAIARGTWPYTEARSMRRYDLVRVWTPEGKFTQASTMRRYNLLKIWES